VERGSSSARRLLLIAALLALLPLAAYALALFFELRSATREEQHATLARHAETVASGLESELSSGLRALETLAHSVALERRDLPAFREEARRLLGREQAWHTIALFEGGRQVMNLRHAPDATPDLIELPVTPVLLSGRASARELPDGRILLRVPVKSDGAVRAALVAVLEASALGAPLLRVRLPPGWAAQLLDADGLMLAGGPAPPVPPGDLLAALVVPGRAHPVASGWRLLTRRVAETGWAVLLVAPEERSAASWPVLGVVLLLSAGVLGASVLLGARGALRLQAAEWQRGAAEAAARASVQERRRTDLLATVSHELRAPLTGLLGYTDLLLRADLPQQPREWVEQQKRAGEVLLALIGDVLDLARMEDGAIELEETDIDLPAFLAETAGLMRALAAQKGLKLTVVADGGLPRWIKGDPLRLRQIATNLLSNAVKFTTAGEITLSARMVPGPERLEISVRDTGMGIPPEELPRIFDAFRQASPDTARRFGGSGLGLAICKRLATAMGGTIEAESQPGEGSRFLVTVPFRPGAAPPAARSDGALRLLVAEDVPASRLLLQALLQRAGHEVTAVEDGARALAALHGASFDLALLDLQMPEMDGMGVAAAIRRMPGEAGRLPLIALTADPPEEVEARCRAAGFDAVLRKPFETRRLLGLIEALRGRRPEAVREADSAAAA
jgi:signal transduction histidine kinase/CheY-like chemotaxis protein